MVDFPVTPTTSGTGRDTEVLGDLYTCVSRLGLRRVVVGPTVKGEAVRRGVTRHRPSLSVGPMVSSRVPPTRP